MQKKKKCSKCGENKELECFGKDKYTRLGVTHKCKQCISDIQKIKRLNKRKDKKCKQCKDSISHKHGTAVLCDILCFNK